MLGFQISGLAELIKYFAADEPKPTGFVPWIGAVVLALFIFFLAGGDDDWDRLKSIMKKFKK